jgi:hypothetical protein
MRVQLTDEQRIVEGLGLYVVGKPLEKHFSVVADGENVLIMFCFLGLTAVSLNE